jgi:hypothetical protein
MTKIIKNTSIYVHPLGEHGVFMNSKTSTYTGFEFEIDDFPAVAIINKDLADKSIQAKYSSSIFIEVIPDSLNEHGHPKEAEYDYLVDIEKKMMDYLEDQTGTVHVGPHYQLPQTGNYFLYQRAPESRRIFKLLLINYRERKYF